MQNEKGIKHDVDKAPVSLLDPYTLAQTAYVLQFGAQKYARHNWRGGIAYTRLIDAGMRHLMAINSGEDHDPETGLPHAAHLMCCAMFLCWMMEFRTDMDDRWAPPPNYTVPEPQPVPTPASASMDDLRAVVMRNADDIVDEGLMSIVKMVAPEKKGDQ